MSLHRQLAERIARQCPNYGSAADIEQVLLSVWPTERMLADKIAEIRAKRRGGLV